MALESATYISDLVSTNPTSSDNLSQGDDHLRLLKSTIKATFPNVSGAVTPTHTELNKLTASGSPQFSTIELGNASDTTISRSAAGVIAVEGGVIPKENRANTFSADQVINANVGIGTTPSAKFHVVGPSGGASGQFTDNVNSTLVIKHEAGSLLTYEGVGSSVHRWVNNSTERMRIDASGNVGIGTASPAVPVDVVGQIRSRDGTVDLRMLPISASGSAIFGAISNHPLVIYTNNTERMRIDASGNVGIGTSSISTRLHVDSGAVDEVARLNSSGNTYLSWYRSNVREAFIQATSASFVIWGEQAKPLVLATNNSERMRVDASGNVLVTGPGGLGYGTGSGGSAIQATSKTNGVALSKTNGQITTAGSAITANGNATFTVTNSTVAATDNIILTKVSGGTANRYTLQVTAVAAGSFDITILNNSASSQSDVIVLNFAVIKAVTA